MAYSPIKLFDGRTIFGQKNGDLGPANVYWGGSTKPNLTGTVSTTGTALTGTGTLFTSELSVGDYILADNEIRKIATITSDTVATLATAFTVDLSADTYKKYTEIWLGNTGEVSIMDSEKFADLKFIQTGDNPFDRVLVGYESTIKVQLGELELEKLEKLFQHIKGQYNAGAYEGMYRTVSTGLRHSSYWDQLKVVKIVNGADSTDFRDQIIFPRCAPSGNIDVKFDSSSQKFAEVTFNVYADDTKLIGGKPCLWYSGTVTFDP